MLCLSVAVVGLTLFSLHAAAVPLASPEAVASLMANIPADHAAALASLMARGNDPAVLESLLDKRQNHSMSVIIDSYILNLKQAGFVPNANATNSKRNAVTLNSLTEKRSFPSMPLVIDLLEQHGFVPTSSPDSDAPSKRAVPPPAEPALEKRTMPDLGLVISRLEAHGFVPSGNRSQSTIARRNNSTAGDINTVISQLEAYGFNPNDYMRPQNTSAALWANGSTSATPPSNSTAPV